MSKTIGILMGSFRARSFSRSIARYVAAHMPEGCEAVFAPLDELLLFNQELDDEGAPPEQWTRFRAQVAAFDAVLFVTPEHNRSFPAVLKNALDIASRPAGQSVWGGKPAAVITVSPGRLGGALGNQHLRQPLSFLGLKVLLQPELYIGDVAGLLSEEGELIDQGTQQRLEAFLAVFIPWVEAQTRS
jgi:chromate reductase